MLRRTIGLTIALLVMVAFMVTQCGKKDPVFAKIGNTVITLQDYLDQNRELIKNKDDDYQTALEDVKTRLNRMVENKLVLLQAYEDGFDQDAQILEKTGNAHIQAMIGGLFQKEVIDKVVTEADMKLLYKNSLSKRDIREIVFNLPAGPDSARAAVYQKAEETLRSIKKGAHFASMARKVSDKKESAEAGGLVRDVTFKRINDVVEKTIFSLKKGQWSDIIEFKNKLHIVKVEKIEPLDLPPYNDYRDQLEKRISTQNRQEINRKAMEYWRDLKEKNHVEFNDPNIDSCATLMLLCDTYKRDEMIDGMDTLSQEQKDLVLVTFDGGRHTIEDLTKHMRQLVPIEIRGERFGEPGEIKKFIDQWLMLDLFPPVARSHGLHKNKAVVKKTATVRDNEILRAYSGHAIFSNTPATDEEIRAYYEAHLETRFTSPAQYKVREIVLNSEPDANRVLTQLRSGANFESLVKKHSTQESTKKKNGELGWMTASRYPKRYAAAGELKVNGISDIVPISEDKFVIIQLIDIKERSQRTLDNVKSQIRHLLKTERQDREKAAWFEKQKALRNVSVHETAIQKAIREALEKNDSKTKEG